MIELIIGIVIGYVIAAMSVPSFMKHRAASKIPVEYQGKKYIIVEQMEETRG